MPRGAKKIANQHNTRHENGIVAPGKRITKQKSNGHLNGSPDAKSKVDTPPTLPPVTLQLQPQSPDRIVNGSYTSVKGTPLGGTRHDYQGQSLAEVISEELEGLENGTGYNNMVSKTEQTHRRIDVNAAKPPSGQDAGVIHFALTVLKSCPLRDTLAILIFLLSLPPTCLTLTNAIFALLTFVPPSGSLLNLPTFSEITSSISPGAPSFTVMCVIDIVSMGLWLGLYTPVQSLILDWAQAMVATTLGGGYSNRQGGSDSTLLCMGIVSATHAAQYKRVALRLLQRTWLRKWVPILQSLNDDPMPTSRSLHSGRTWLSTIRTIIALHIVCQGITRMIRRWAFQMRDNGHATSTSKAHDPEAIAGSQASAETTGVADLNHPPHSPTELRSRGSLQNLREVRDKISSGKRRRKQGNYVRSQQPLWAAFAATKATIMREYDQSQATTDAMGSNATDVQNLGSAPFVLEGSRIWVTLVQPTSFFFDTSFLPPNKSFQESDGEDGSERDDDSGIDRSKPFYVRLNGAAWASAKIQEVADHENEQGQSQWTGEVYGLSPSYSYQVSFVRCEDDAVIHLETIATPSSPIAEQASATLTGLPHQNLRPSAPTSPITTLKASIAAFESSLNEVSAQQRRIRKDAKATTTALRKDLDILSDRLHRVGNNDRSLQTRQLQQAQHMRQADDAITLITDELDSCAALPEQDTEDWDQEKAGWEATRNAQSHARESHFRAKESNTRASTTIQGEGLTASQKRERLQHRAAKLADQHKRLHSSTTQDASEKERTMQELDAKGSERLNLESKYQEQINALARAFQDVTFRSRTTWHQNNMLETAAEQAAILAAHAANMSDSRPITPEGDLPGTIPQSAGSTGHHRFPAFGSPDPQHLSLANGFLRGENRARSTSVLSGNSVYEDFEDDLAPPPLTSGAKAKRRSIGSHGWGSGNFNDGRGSASGSGSASSAGGASPGIMKSPQVG